MKLNEYNTNERSGNCKLLNCSLSECAQTDSHYGRRRKLHGIENALRDTLQVFPESLYDRVYYFLFRFFDHGLRVNSSKLTLNRIEIIQ